MGEVKHLAPDGAKFDKPAHRRRDRRVGPVDPLDFLGGERCHPPLITPHRLTADVECPPMPRVVVSPLRGENHEVRVDRRPAEAPDAGDERGDGELSHDRLLPFARRRIVEPDHFELS